MLSTSHAPHGRSPHARPCVGRAAALLASPLPPPTRRGSSSSSWPCRGLKENVAALPSAASVTRISLPQLRHDILPMPGKMASVAIYHHLAAKYDGCLGPDAAREGLQLYAEAADDARLHPGSHPNIDLLLQVLQQDLRVDIVVVHAE